VSEYKKKLLEAALPLEAINKVLIQANTAPGIR